MTLPSETSSAASPSETSESFCSAASPSEASEGCCSVASFHSKRSFLDALFAYSAQQVGSSGFDTAFKLKCAVADSVVDAATTTQRLIVDDILGAVTSDDNGVSCSKLIDITAKSIDSIKPVMEHLFITISNLIQSRQK